MAKKISELTAASALLGAEMVPVVQGGVTKRVSVSSLRLVDSDTGALGYATGSGGSVTQATSKSTGVTLNKPSGRVITHNEALAAGAVVSFTLTNSTIGAMDVVSVCMQSGATPGAYSTEVSSVGAGQCVVSIRNLGAVSLSEAISLNFVVLKGSTS